MEAKTKEPKFQKEVIMKGNPQNIEVGDVVTFRNTTSMVLEVTVNNHTEKCSFS
mgnify:CR=1 FL=1